MLPLLLIVWIFPEARTFRGSDSDFYSNFLTLASWGRRGRREVLGFLGLVNNTVVLRRGVWECVGL